MREQQVSGGPTPAHGPIVWLVASIALVLVVATIQVAAGGGPATTVLESAPAGATEDTTPPATAAAAAEHSAHDEDTDTTGAHDGHTDTTHAATHDDDAGHDEHTTHDTTGDAHDHDTATAGTDGHGDHTTGTTTTGHDHGADGGTGTTPTTGHDHGGDGGTGTTPTTGHDHGGDGGGGTTDELSQQTLDEIAVSREIAMQYPTAADAVAAGWVQITVHFPGIAAHYIRWEWLDNRFVLEQPEVLLYSGNGLDAPLVGVNYIVSGAQPPAGFTGDADHWHEHPTLCVSLTSGLVIGGENVSAAQCKAMGGTVISFAGNWLLHVWCIPGWESPEGIFSHENSLVL